MAEVPDNSDEQLYETDDFEDEPVDDAVSEAEHEVEEQLEEQLEEQDAESENSQSDESENSDTEVESDIEAEFARCNVSSTNNMQELTIKQFSLSNKSQTAIIPQPYDREHFYGRMLSGRSSTYNREIKKYSSSSSDEDGNGVVTKTMAEVNVHASDDDAASGRTLVPHEWQSHNAVKMENDNDELEEELEENDVNNDLKGDDEDFMVQGYDDDDDDDNRSLVAEEVDEEEQEDMDYMDDIEIGQLTEEQECEDHYIDNKIYAGAYVEDTDNSSGSWCIGYTNVGQQVQPEKPQQTISHFEEKQDMINAEEEPIDKKTEAQVEPQLRQTDAAQITETKTMEIEIETTSLYDFISEEDDDFDADNTNVANQTLDALNADAAAVKYLELQMNEMSEMIKKTFRISSGANDQLAAKPKPAQFVGHTLPKLPEEELENSMGDSELADNQSHCDISEFSLEMQEDSVETLTTVRTSRQKCRCPTEIADVKATFMMDECGQGDGLMRHPHSHYHHHHDIDFHVSNVRPGSFKSEQAFHVNLKRPQSSKEKVNYKNLGRKSFSFSNTQVREIERQNQILLKKMMSVKPTIKANVNKSNSHVNVKTQPQPATRTSSAAINRKKFQRKVDEENNMLKRKLEAIGSRRSQFK